MVRYGVAIAIISVIIFAGLTVSQEGEKGPRIAITEANFDFGFAPEGTYMVHEYVLKNIGTEPLEIKRVRTTCGCTSAPVKKNLLQPDEATVVTLWFNSTRYFHKTSKAAIISSNDETRPSEKITFVADMDTTKERAIIPVPRKIDLGRGTDLKKEFKVSIKNISSETVTLKVVDFYGELLDAPVLTVTELAPKAQTDVIIKVKSVLPAEESIRGSFTIAALNKNGIETTRITVPVASGGS